MTWRGGWSNGVLYAKNDAVQYLGSSWIAVIPNQFVAPNSNNGYWHLLAAAGSPGPQGPAGAQGVKGATGPAGPPGPVGISSSHFFASVNSVGGLDHGYGVNTVSHTGTGTYSVFFTSDITSCAYQATIGAPRGGFGAGFISVTRDLANAKAVDVRVLGTDGTTPTNLSFFLTADC
jgi:hypothetical protein